MRPTLQQFRHMIRACPSTPPNTKAISRHPTAAERGPARSAKHTARYPLVAISNHQPITEAASSAKAGNEHRSLSSCALMCSGGTEASELGPSGAHAVVSSARCRNHLISLCCDSLAENVATLRPTSTIDFIDVLRPWGSARPGAGNARNIKPMGLRSGSSAPPHPHAPKIFRRSLDVSVYALGFAQTVEHFDAR